MKRLMHLILISIIGIALCSCATNLSNLQRRSIESKELQGSFDDALKSTLQILQDYGYVITHTDYESGVIKGETGWKSRGIFVPRKQEVSVIIEEWGENRVKERITFMVKEDMGFGTERSRIIEDPQLLQKIYDDIQKEIFVRQQLGK